MTFDIKGFKHIFDMPENVVGDSFWNEHIPFAFFMIDILRPTRFVELGVFKGASYNAFCQAVKELKAGTKCYGVDNFEGDPHNGLFGIDVYNELADYQLRNYKEFSSLLKMPFDEALHKFADGSIDLLHIDGYHTYEAVRHDYESWLPKMSERGVVILHDTNERKLDYGVWKLWEEIAKRYPSFEFKHGCGLGVLAVGGSVKKEFLGFLTEAKHEDFYPNLFGILGKNVKSMTNEVKLAENELTIKRQEEALKQQDKALKQQDEGLKQQDKALRQREEALKQQDEGLKQQDKALKQQDNALKQLDRAWRQKDQELTQIVTSIKWRLAVKTSQFSQYFAPLNSRRRQLLKWLINKLGVK